MDSSLKLLVTAAPCHACLVPWPSWCFSSSRSRNQWSHQEAFPGLFGCGCVRSGGLPGGLCTLVPQSPGSDYGRCIRWLLMFTKTLPLWVTVFLIAVVGLGSSVTHMDGLLLPEWTWETRLFFLQGKQELQPLHVRKCALQYATSVRSLRVVDRICSCLGTQHSQRLLSQNMCLLHLYWMNMQSFVIEALYIFKSFLNKYLVFI